MIVVSNSTPLISLAAIGKFDLLRTLHGRIYVPDAVFDEVVAQGSGRWGAAEVAVELIAGPSGATTIIPDHSRRRRKSAATALR